MRNKVKIFFIGAMFLLVVSLSYFSYTYYESVIKDITNLETQLYLKPDNLEPLFRSNEIFANSIYTEKVIEIEGAIKEIIYQDQRYTIALQCKDKSSCVLCAMLPEMTNTITKLRPGKTVVIKGICKGYLNDVIMLNCIIVNR